MAYASTPEPHAKSSIVAEFGTEDEYVVGIKVNLNIVLMHITVMKLVSR